MIGRLRAAEALLRQRALKMAPDGITPCSRMCQSAMASFLAMATTPTLRLRAPLSANRARYLGGECALRLMPHPGPSDLDEQVLAGLFPAFADALPSLHVAACIRVGAGPRWMPDGEFSVEDLGDEQRGAQLPDPYELC